MEEKKETKKTKFNSKYTKALGRRKEAIASVRLFKGRGETIVNGKPINEYFPSKYLESIYKKPFNLTKAESQYYATILVKGSGKSSQLDAVVHGLSRALSEISSEFRSTLKKAGLLTRDPRVKERRKYGNAQKARKGKQSPKR